MTIKYADPSMPLEERCERLNAALNQALDQKEALEAKLAGVQAKLDGLRHRGMRHIASLGARADEARS